MTRLLPSAVPEWSRDLSGLGIAVTGAASGIGRALAAKLFQAGANVAAIDISEQGLRELQTMPRAGGASRGFVCDVRSDDQVARVMEDIKAWLPSLDSIVHCAGVGRYAPFLELTESDWLQMVEVNLLGAVRLARHALPGMVTRGSGQFVIVGSRRGAEPAVGTSAYSASKAAVAAFARGLALEVSDKGVHVCLVAPGGVRTNFGSVDAAAKDKRFLEPDTIAESVLHILRHRGNAWVRDLTLLPLGL
jgi:3-oxoacyl-[acyl-carrier protein] reductase